MALVHVITGSSLGLSLLQTLCTAFKMMHCTIGERKMCLERQRSWRLRVREQNASRWRLLRAVCKGLVWKRGHTHWRCETCCHTWKKKVTENEIPSGNAFAGICTLFLIKERNWSTGKVILTVTWPASGRAMKSKVIVKIFSPEVIGSSIPLFISGSS